MGWEKWLAFGIIALGVTLSAQEVPLARAGRSDYRIVVPGDATPAELTAATELYDFLQAVTGAELPRVSAPGDDGRNIWVGSTATAAQRFDFDPAQLRPDEILLLTNDAGELLLAGARPRGSLYAVYTLLEDYCGVRFWTSSETDIPQRPDLTLPELQIRYAPPIQVRETYTDDFSHHLEFSVRRRNNGHHPNIPPEWGGHDEVIGFVHTFDRLLPAAEYLGSHPEFFSLRDGKRVGGQLTGQLCLSNPEVLRRITVKVLEQLRLHPNPRIISVTQNDNHNSCQCPECLAADARYASPAGTLLAFVNAVAAEVEREFPDVLIETLAYQYTRSAPVNIQPRHNVIVRLCSIECDFAKALSAPENAAFGNDLRAWSQLTDQLAIWDYTGNFSNHLAAYPNFSTYADNIRFFAANHVKVVFSQNIYQTGDRAGDWLALRGWLISKLLWQPELSQRELEDKFLSGYYGSAAAPFLRQYLDLLENAVQSRHIQLTPLTHVRADQYLTVDTIEQARKLMEAALAATSQEEQRRRVRIAKLGIDTAFIEAAPLWRWISTEAPEVAEFQAVAREAVTEWEKCGAVTAREGTDFSFVAPVWLNLGRMLTAPRPERFAKVAPQDYFEVQDGWFSPSNTIAATRVSDPSASDGQATQMANDGASWAFQYEFPQELRAEGAKWHLYLALKCAYATEGPGVTTGVYHRAERAGDYRTLPATEIAGDEYTIVDLGSVELRETSYFFISPVPNPATGPLFIDRLILIREAPGAE